MLGLVRFVLALSVVAFHLTAAIPNLGLLAVNFFYVISGFLITLVLHETYKFSLRPFAINRFLRLYPSYYAIAGAGILLSLIFSEYSRFHVSWSSPPSIADAAGNLLIFPWAALSDDVVQVNFLDVDELHSAAPYYRVVPSTWSVGVEIVCYFLLWIFTARNLASAIVTIVLAGLWQVFVFNESLDARLAYFPFLAAMLPFGFGALGYHFVKRANINTLSSSTAPWVTLGTLILFFLNWRYSTQEKEFIGSGAYYVNTLLAFASILIINKTKLHGTLGKVDKWTGDLAYPMFLGHYIFAFIAWKLIGSDNPIRGWSVFLIGGILTIAASAIVILIIDQKLITYRNRVRAQPSSSQRNASRTELIP